MLVSLRVWRRHLVWASLASVGVSWALAGCFGPQDERLSCEDVLPAADANFSGIVELVLNDPEKHCIDEPCHAAKTQQAGIRLDDPDLIYDELSTRPELFYSVLASGVMPQAPTHWSEDDLRLFRSWYCSGAFPP